MGNKLECKEQLKAVLMDCGVKGEPCVLLAVTKCDQEQDDLLHDLQELVVCGEVYGLFNIDEVENIVSQMADPKTVSSKCWMSFVKVCVRLYVSNICNGNLLFLDLYRECRKTCMLCFAAVLQVRS